MTIGTALALRVLRVRAASVMHHAWAATMFTMLLLPVWTTWGPAVTAPVLPSEPARMEILTIDTSGLADGAVPFFDAAASPERFARPLSVAGPSTLNWRTILLALYLAGLALMLARLLRGTLAARSMLRGATPAEGFLRSSRCAAPLTIGWLRPVVLVPESWSDWCEAKREAVLIHEREHVRRRDPLVQWLALLNRCIFWFHPVAWWLQRRLAALAEDSCDTAVLVRGHAPDDYARHLIELAQAVNEAGARIRWAGVVAFSAGSLPRRIRRILAAEPSAPTPRAKSAALAGSCSLLLAACLACGVGRHKTSPSTRVSYKEAATAPRTVMLTRSWNAQTEEALLEDAVLGLTPGRAKIREAELRNDPHEPFRARELVRYYESKKNWKALDALTLWFIREHPDVRENWGTRPAWDRVWDTAGYEAARQAWMEQFGKARYGPYFYMNGGEYLSGTDNEAAERMFLEGQKRFPAAALHWEVFLARHYAWALAGSGGPLPEGYLVLTNGRPATTLNQNAYASAVREKLLGSNDLELVERNVEQLQSSDASTALAESLNERVLAIDPNNSVAHVRREDFRERPILLRAKTDPTKLSDSDRIVYLDAQLGRRWSGAQDREANAKELLALASRNPNDPNYGTAIFLANMELGEAALKQGNRAGAVKHLLAASAAPPTEYLRYYQINLSLPSGLLDAGERQAVATFLDRCARFNQSGMPWGRWAAEVRKGQKPFDPYRTARVTAGSVLHLQRAPGR